MLRMTDINRIAGLITHPEYDRRKTKRKVRTFYLVIREGRLRCVAYYYVRQNDTRIFKVYDPEPEGLSLVGWTATLAACIAADDNGSVTEAIMNAQ